MPELLPFHRAQNWRGTSLNRRKICVVTGSRAEYGLLYWLLKEIEEDQGLELQILVTGMHLEERFGYTVETIESDGFEISARVSMDISDDKPTTIAKSIGRGVIGITDAFATLDPDCIVVLGDRYEMLAAGQSAMMMRIPLAHIYGGEASEGSVDEAIRHALSKLSHLHFVAAEEYRHRVIQMGEQPSSVFNVGAACLDNLEKLELLDRAQLADELKFEISKAPYFLVTYHPVTLSSGDQSLPVREMLRAIEGFADHKVIITGVNSDPGNRDVGRVVEKFAKANEKTVIFFNSLGHLKYLSAMKHAAVVVGNSSSGIVEAPAINVPTVNIGDRQRGRIRAASVIDCLEDEESIKVAIARALDSEFIARARKAEYPFGKPGVAARIKSTLASVDLSNIQMKHFYDLPFENHQ